VSTPQDKLPAARTFLRVGAGFETAKASGTALARRKTEIKKTNDESILRIEDVHSIE
jgi:hypothetical protein